MEKMAIRWQTMKRQPSSLRLRLLQQGIQRRVLQERFTYLALQRLVPPAPRELLHEERLDGPLAPHFVEQERERLAEVGIDYKGAKSTGWRHIFLYAIARALDAEHVVETGVANGWTSTYFLAALERSGGGRLHSIDLPFFDDFEAGAVRGKVEGTELPSMAEFTPLAPGRDAGWLVPERLRSRWDLRLGDSAELLPALLSELGTIDFFFHDSTHTREHILFELEAAWPHVRPGGVLGADDVFLRDHEAVPEFARSRGLPFVVYEGMGFIRKP